MSAGIPGDVPTMLSRYVEVEKRLNKIYVAFETGKIIVPSIMV
jgi:hypothetical protein